MPKYLVEMDGKKYQFEGDHPPTEEEARQAIAPQQESSASPEQIDASQFEDKPSPLTATQNLMLGFMPDDAKPVYLQKEFAGRNVEATPEGLKVDGAPVNPKGFDSGDILRSLGYAYPFVGQVAGGIAGGSVGASAGPVGTVGGGMAGGVAGATAGESMRLATGKFLLSALGKNLELENEGQMLLNSLADTAKSAAVGEVIGGGIPVAGSIAGRGLSKTQLYRGTGDAWTKTINKLKTTGSPVEDILQFVGKVDKNATRVVQRDKPSVVLNEKYFDPDKTSKIASNTIFGTEDFYTLGATNTNGVSKGSVALAKSIKEIDDPSYDYLLQTVGIDKEFIDGVRNSNVDNIINPVNTNNPRRGFELASNVIKEISEQEKIIGQQLEKAERKAINSRGSVYFDGSDLANKIDEIVGSGSLLKATKIPGFEAKAPVSVVGADKLKELSGILKGNRESITKDGVKITEKRMTSFDKIPPKQFYNIKRQFDAKVDEIFRNERIPGEIRSQVKDIAKEFRSRYYNYLDIGDEAKAFKEFKDLTDGIKLEGRNAVITLENKVSSFKNITGAEQDELIKALQATPNGSKLVQQINEFNLSKSIKNINPEQMIKSMAAPLSTKRFLDSNLTDSVQEGILRKISDSMSGKATSRQFAQEAERALAAKAFLGSNQDLLRISTLAGMLGLGGFKAFGPLGGIAGAGLSLAIANPQNLGKMLIMAEKQAPNIKRSAERFGRGVKVDAKKKAVLSSLLSVRDREKTSERREKQKSQGIK